MRNHVKLLYLALALLVVYTFWPGGTNDQEPARPMWETSLDEQGNLQIMGVTLGKTTLKEAEAILRSRSQRALFIPPDTSSEKSPRVEAFFPSMPDNSKLILGLSASTEQIETLKIKAHNPSAFPSGNIKLEIADDHMSLVEGLVVDMLTAIPRIRITPQEITAQFGEPQILHRQDDILHYLYPARGLDVILDQSGEAMIQFVSPGDFQRVLDRLGIVARENRP